MAHYGWQNRLIETLISKDIIKDEVDYIENIGTHDVLQVNLTIYPSEKVIGWRNDILHEVASISPDDNHGYTWKTESI